MKAAFNIERSGPMSLLQAGARVGYRHLGMPLSGPQDTFACRVGNSLVGNSLESSVLEMTGGGVRMVARADLIIAICGSGGDVRIDGERADRWRSMPINEGQVMDVDPFPLGR
jgi:allophanate hydrolase subunit 2